MFEHVFRSDTYNLTITSLIVIFLVLISVSWAGSLLVSLLKPTLTASRIWALGILIGGLALSLSTLVTTYLGINQLWGVVAIVVGGVLLQILDWRTSGSVQDTSSLSIERGLVIRAGGLSLIGFNTFSLWTTILGVAALLSPAAGLIHVANTMRSRLYSVALSLGAIAASVTLLNAQPRWHWAQSNDAPFFEAMSVVVATYGPDTHPGYLNGSVVGYHYLAYLWSGILTVLGNAQPFVVLNIVLPLVSVFSVALLLLEQSEDKPRLRINALFILVLILVTRYNSFTSDSMASWAIICYVVLLAMDPYSDSASEIKLSYLRNQLLLSLLGLAAVLGKGTALPVILAVGGSISVVSFATSQERLVKRIVASTPIHLPIIALVTWAWYAPASNSAIVQSSSNVPISAIRSLGLNEGLWVNRDIAEIFPLLILISVIAFFARLDSLSHSSRHLYESLVVFCCLAAVMQLILPDSNLRGYIAGHSLLIVIVFLYCIVNLNAKIGLAEVLRLPLVVGLLIAYLVIAVVDVRFLPGFVESLWPNATPRSRWIALMVSNSRFFLVIAVTLVATLVVLLARRLGLFANQEKRLGILGATLPLFCFGLAVWHVVNRADQVSASFKIDSDVQTSAFTSSHPDEYTLNLGEWIRKNTSGDLVLASNSFCCRGSDWLDDALKQLRQINTNYAETRNLENMFGGANYLLPAVTQRRFLIAGPRFFVTPEGSAIEKSNSQTSQVELWLEASVRFGESGDPQFGKVLKLAGARYFVVDKFALREGEYQGAANSRVFENQRYLVLAL